MIRSRISKAIAFALAVGLAAPLSAQTLAGSYLAGRNAALSSDFEEAARYFTRALARQPGNPDFQEEAIIAQLALGRPDRALPIARLMEDRGLRSQVAHMLVIGALFEAEEYDRFLARDLETQGIGSLVDGLLVAWARLGTGDRDGAVAQFDDIADQRGLRGFATYHKAMALASVGDFAAAEALFVEQAGGPLQQTRRGAMARAEILSQLGQNEDAIASLEAAFGAVRDPELALMLERLQAGQTLEFTHITSARDGAAEVFFSVAGALQQDAGSNYTLLYGRMARYLRPGHIDALLLNAELLEDLEQFDLANAEYKAVPADHPAFHAAELGRAAALRQSGKPDAAIEVLEQLTRQFPDLPMVHSTLGDVLRAQERFEEATPAYDRAISLTDEDVRGLWFLHYARAITLERQGRWDEAEVDFRRALELNPGQPQVLNYLGYSLVEKRIKLDEALAMIEEAVEATNAESGYIVDSLGWVLYRLGRYEEAVEHMELAVELLPVDPVVNDHLGDVYWAVGRYREAEFQWKRALSFVDEANPGDAQPERMRRKLEVGLYKVLEDEGADPVTVANGD